MEEENIKDYVNGLRVSGLREEIKKRNVSTSSLKNKTQLRHKLYEILINEASWEQEREDSQNDDNNHDEDDADQHETSALSVEDELNVTMVPATKTSKVRNEEYYLEKEREIIEKEKEVMRKEKEVIEKEKEITKKEKEIMEKEKEVIERENKTLREELALLRLRNETITPFVTPELEVMPSPEKFKVNVGHVTEMIPFYDPDINDYDSWEQQSKEIMSTYSVQPDVMKTIMVSKLRGRAQRFFYSRPIHITLTLNELLQELGKMFRTKQSRMRLRRKFDERLWKSNEMFADYYHDKVIMANSLELETEEIIEYIIDGMDDNVLESQAKIQRFKCLEDLFDSFVKIKKLSHPRKVMPKNIGKKPVPPATGSDPIRCYNCNIGGHTARECRKPVRERGSCFACGKFGHYSAACPVSKKNVAAIMENRPEIFKEVIVKISIENFNFSSKMISLLDTGSSVSLLREDVVPDKMLVYFTEQGKYYDKDFYGINNSKLKIMAVIKINVNFNNEEKEINVFVVPKETMSFGLLLGRNFMSEFRFDLVQISEEDFEEKLLLIDVTDNYEQDIRFGAEINERIKKKFMVVFKEQYVKSVKPEKPKIDYEMEIRLEKESPFHCTPRRLSFYEKSELKKILQDIEDRLLGVLSHHFAHQ